jgi:hypothetical protein
VEAGLAQQHRQTMQSPQAALLKKLPLPHLPLIFTFHEMKKQFMLVSSSYLDRELAVI